MTTELSPDAPIVAVDQAAMADQNRALVLDLIRRTGPTSRAELSRVITLSKVTISAIVDQLIADGRVRETGLAPKATGGRGRPPRLIEYDARSQLVAGVHIGVQETQVQLADGLGRSVSHLSAPTVHGDPALSLRAVRRLLRRALREVGVTDGGLAALAVCVPGGVDGDAGICRSAPNLGWSDVDIRTALAGTTSDFRLLNDAQAALVAEHREGAANGVSSAVLLYAGSGIGAAFLMNGEPYRGATGRGGLVGHLPVPGAAARCGCGQTGCLETVASVQAIVRAYFGGRRGRAATLRAVVDAAESGDATAAEVLTTAGRELGRAAALVVSLLDPQTIVMTGGLVEAGPLFHRAMQRELAQRTAGHPHTDTMLKLSALGARAELRGAVLTALDRSQQAVVA